MSKRKIYDSKNKMTNESENDKAFKGEIDALKGYIFQCHGEGKSSKRYYAKTCEKLGKQMASEMCYL